MELQKAGFSDLSTELEKQIKQGQQQFSIPVSYYVNEKEHLDHQLFISKDHTGQYQFEGFKTKLYHEAKMDDIREHYFGKNEDTVMDTALAYQLLKGRSIQKEDKWLQLDLNDKDAQGNYRIKEFHSVYGFDLEKILGQLPLKELQNKDTTYKLSEDLKKGIRQAVSFIKDGKEQRYYIEANPQFKSVNIYDQHSRKITLATALGNKTTEAIKLTHKLNEKKVQGQMKRNGMKIP